MFVNVPPTPTGVGGVTLWTGVAVHWNWSASPVQALAEDGRRSCKGEGVVRRGSGVHGWVGYARIVGAFRPIVVPGHPR